jgi:hypothetical protein
MANPYIRRSIDEASMVVGSRACGHGKQSVRPILRRELVNKHDAESSSKMLSMIVDGQLESAPLLPLPSSEWPCM